MLRGQGTRERRGQRQLTQSLLLEVETTSSRRHGFEAGVFGAGLLVLAIDLFDAITGVVQESTHAQSGAQEERPEQEG